MLAKINGYWMETFIVGNAIGMRTVRWWKHPLAWLQNWTYKKQAGR